MIGQSKRNSLLEAITNTGLGLLIAWASTTAVFALCGVVATQSQIGGVVILMTGVSVARSYVVRRIWNWIETKRAKK
jgi:hypothetical protein